MKYLLTSGQMRKADEYTIGQLGVPSLMLMERAGKALADEAEKLAGKGGVLCVCGGGNNGGDGFVCARILKAKGIETDVLFYADKQSEDCRINAERWQETGGKTVSEIDRTYSLIVDCLFGTGFKGGLEGKNAETVQKMNAMKRQGSKILSADIPSGINGDNGRVRTVAVYADVTLCIGEIKSGVLFGDGIDHAGEIKRADIGIELPDNLNEYAYFLEEKEITERLPARKRNSNKGTYGRAAIVAGSLQYTGAAYLSAAACLRSGAGYTTLFLPEGILPYYVLKLPEALLCPIGKGKKLHFKKGNFKKLLHYDCIAYGMGMGISLSVAKGASYLLENYTGKLILDADALNSLAKYQKGNFTTLFKEKKCDVILTPHIKEFARLTDLTVESILDNPFCVKEISEKYRVNILLKNAVSLIVGEGKTVCNIRGNSGQAKGGSGDVLSGVLASLCAMGLSTFDGACTASYLVGKAAELAAREKGEYSLSATDLISYLGRAFYS